MNPIMVSAKVMQNYTICIAQPIRERMHLEKGDQVILSLDESGDVTLTKAVATLDDLVGIGKETFNKLGGGEHFLKKERKMWD